MATGINKSEQLSPDARLATRPHEDPMPLPPSKSTPELVYPNKASEEQILAPTDLSFSSISSQGVSPISRIETNSFVLSDNFFALHDLINSNLKATLIYLDPPYGTGLDFQSRNLEHAYKDNLCPSTYIEYMRRRLILMREVLDDDGAIYVHIGHQMLAHLKVIMDEVFGPKNFRNLISRRKCSSKNFTRKQYANIHDYLLFYSKSNNFKWNQPTMVPEQDWIDKEYPKLDIKGRYKLVPVHAPGTRNGETGKEWKGRLPPPGKHWQYAPAKLDELDAIGEIHWSKNGNPRRKVYLTKDKSLPYTDNWQGFRDAHHQSIKITGYPTEKNFDMLKMIVTANSDPGDLVIDPFVGSGTTIHAAADLGRKWIGIDESFVAARNVLKRFGHGVEKMGDYVNQPNRNQEQLSLTPGKSLHPSSDFKFLVDSWLLSEHQTELTDLYHEFLS